MFLEDFCLEEYCPDYAVSFQADHRAHGFFRPTGTLLSECYCHLVDYRNKCSLRLTCFRLFPSFSFLYIFPPFWCSICKTKKMEKILSVIGGYFEIFNFILSSKNQQTFLSSQNWLLETQIKRNSEWKYFFAQQNKNEKKIIKCA